MTPPAVQLGAVGASRVAFGPTQAPVAVGIILLQDRLVVLLALFTRGGTLFVTDLAVAIGIPAVQAPFLTAPVAPLVPCLTPVLQSPEHRPRRHTGSGITRWGDRDGGDAG